MVYNTQKEKEDAEQEQMKETVLNVLKATKEMTKQNNNIEQAEQLEK